MFLLSYKRIKRLKAILWCGVVACKDNDKGVECSSGVTGGAVCGVDRLVVVVVGLWWSWEFRELPRTLYHKRNRPLYDTILTSAYTLTIHKTAYLILIILIIYQDKKMG